MRRFPKILAWVCAGCFLLLFLLVPMLNLFLTGFTGEPVPLLEYLCSGRWGALAHDISTQFTWDYYGELLDTRRYRLGFTNSLGLAPLITLIYFCIIRFSAWVLGRLSPAWAKRLRRCSSAPVLGLVFLLVLAVVLAGREIWPRESWCGQALRWLAPGRTWSDRFLQGVGFCPLVTFFCTLIGVAMALAVGRTAMHCRNLVRLLCIVPLALPPFLGALALKNLIGINGILTKCLSLVGLPLPFEAQSAQAAALVQVSLYFPFVFLTTLAALERTNPSLGEAAQVSGAGTGFAFWSVHLPMLIPGISAGAFLAFIRSFGDFSALSLLMPMKYPMIVIEAYRDLSGSTYWGGACMLSTLMVLTILSLLAVQKYVLEGGAPGAGGRGGAFESVGGRQQGSIRLETRPWLCRLSLVFCLSVLALPVTFVLVTFLASVAGSWGIEALPSSYTLERYRHMLGLLLSGDSPLINTFMLVGPALLGALALALLVAYTVARSRHWWRHLLDFSTVLPFVVPGVAFAVALIVTFNGPPIPWHLTAALVVCAYVVTCMPYGVRTTLASFQQINISMEESSRTLGATGVWTLLKVIIPLVMPGLTAGAIMIFIGAVQEVAITLMTCPPDWYPASVYVFIQIQEGDLFAASAYGIILFLLTIVPYTLAWKLAGAKASL